MCECPGSQCHCEVLTAYARECERKGVRIPRWREQTGCKHIVPFKYSGEVMTSAEVSTHVNATLNEVLRQPGEVEEEEAGQEEVEDSEEEEELAVNRLGQAAAAYTVRPSDLAAEREEREKKKTKLKVWRRTEKAKKRKERRRLKKQAKRRQEKERQALGSFKGVSVSVGGGGLVWGGGRGRAGAARKPIFDMLLSSGEEEEEEEEEEGGEVTSEASLLARQALPLVSSERRGSRERQGRGRARGRLPLVPPPPPLEQPEATERDWKRRRQQRL